jgi:hypothetical protein
MKRKSDTDEEKYKKRKEIGPKWKWSLELKIEI